MNKKIKTISTISLVGILTSVSLSIFFIFGSKFKNNILNAEENSFELTFNNETVFPKPDVDEHQVDARDYSYNRFNMNTKEGNFGLCFFYKSAFKYDEGFIGLSAYNGGFGNAYLTEEESPYHGRITGLKSITVNYSLGNTADGSGIDNSTPLLSVNYSYEDDMKLGNYRVTSQKIKSNSPYNFDNNYPTYFSINTYVQANVYIKSIVIKYSCSNANEQKPAGGVFYDPGFHVGVTQLKENGEEKVFNATAYSYNEAYSKIEEAVVKHYRYVTINFDISDGSSENMESFLVKRDNFSHVRILPLQNDLIYNGENNFAILYWNDTGVNNEVLIGDSDDSMNSYGYIDHYNCAQYKTELTPRKPSFVTANNKIRMKYAKDHGLKRNANFNNFAINNITKTLDVYNSEDLWWACLHDYKPTFPLPNSKAEWIYNEAKKVLREIIYDDMTNFEKLRAIYEWIIDTCQYDDDALISGREGPENVCYYLEGVFERHIAVCDGFSKTFCLLGKIEGLDVKRGLGFDASSGGHAWAYARTNSDEPYYLVCPTWGDTRFDFGDETNPDVWTFLDYEPFMTSVNYFYDKSGGKINFNDALIDDGGFSNNPYEPSVYTFDELPNNKTYDYFVESKAEMQAIITAAKSACHGQNYSICFCYDDYNVSDEDIGNWISGSGYYNLLTQGSYIVKEAFLLFKN